MNVDGRIVKYDGKHLLIDAPFTDSDFLMSHQVEGCTVILEDGRQLSAKQRRYIYALIRDISIHTGHEPEFLKELFKLDVLAKTGGNWFSLSDCSMTEANELIEILIQFCIEWFVPTKENLIEFAPDINKYIYMCLKNKVCCITRRSGAELHHVDHVGMGRNRNEISHVGMRAMPLLRKLHTEAHTVGQQTFEEKYHVRGIPMTGELCDIWKVNR